MLQYGWCRLLFSTQSYAETVNVESCDARFSITTDRALIDTYGHDAAIVLLSYIRHT